MEDDEAKNPDPFIYNAPFGAALRRVKVEKQLLVPVCVCSSAFQDPIVLIETIQCNCLLGLYSLTIEILCRF